MSVSNTSIENTNVGLVILLECHLHVQWQAASDIVGVTHSDSWLAFTGWNDWQETSSVTLPLSRCSCCAFWREATGSLLTSWIKSSHWAVTLNSPFLCRLTSFVCRVMLYVYRWISIAFVRRWIYLIICSTAVLQPLCNCCMQGLKFKTKIRPRQWETKTWD